MLVDATKAKNKLIIVFLWLRYVHLSPTSVVRGAADDRINDIYCLDIMKRCFCNIYFSFSKCQIDRNFTFYFHLALNWRMSYLISNYSTFKQLVLNRTSLEIKRNTSFQKCTYLLFQSPEAYWSADEPGVCFAAAKEEMSLKSQSSHLGEQPVKAHPFPH